MYDHDHLIDSCLELTEKLASPYEVNEALFDLAAHLTRLLQLAGSGVTLGMDEQMSTVIAVPPELRALEAFQERTMEGPCVTAFREGEVCVVGDLRNEQRWPGYRKVADQVGVRSVVGVPMKLGGRTFGAMTMYHSRPHDWPETDLRAARVLTNIATAYLVYSLSLNEQTELSAQLQHALENRVLIEQAKGFLAQTHDISVEAAYQRLREHARSHNRRVREIARDVVDRRLSL